MDAIRINQIRQNNKSVPAVGVDMMIVRTSSLPFIFYQYEYSTMIGNAVDEMGQSSPMAKSVESSSRGACPSYVAQIRVMLEFQIWKWRRLATRK